MLKRSIYIVEEALVIVDNSTGCLVESFPVLIKNIVEERTHMVGHVTDAVAAVDLGLPGH